MADGMVLFVDDRQVREWFAAYPYTMKTWTDFGGHYGVDIIYPGTRGNGRDEEGFPLPALMAEAVNRGDLDELHKKAHQCRFRVNEDGQCHGKYEEWHESGSLRVSTTYENGNRRQSLKALLALKD